VEHDVSDENSGSHETADKSKISQNDSKVYDIDFVGTGTFQTSQLNLRQRRSLEPLKGKIE
jgi:hypothetical protein